MKNIYGIIDIPDSYHAPIQPGLPKLYALAGHTQSRFR